MPATYSSQLEWTKYLPPNNAEASRMQTVTDLIGDARTDLLALDNSIEKAERELLNLRIQATNTLKRAHATIDSHYSGEAISGAVMLWTAEAFKDT